LEQIEDHIKELNIKVVSKIVVFKYQLALGTIAIKNNKLGAESSFVQISERDDAISQ